MSSRNELKLDWCSHAAARYAVEHWHYSKCLPVTKCNYIGVWEANKFIGVVVWSLGAASRLGAPYGLVMGSYAELARVGLREHGSPVSRIVSIALRMLRTKYPNMRLAISFADTNEGHVGGIYQAGNWLYTGMTSSAIVYKYHGRWVHSRTLGVQWGKRKPKTIRDRCESKRVPGKHRYLMPLDDEMRRQIEPLAKPYPKRATSLDSEASANHAGEGGASPTVALLEAKT